MTDPDTETAGRWALRYRGKIFKLGDAPVTVGRSLGCQFVIDDLLVSRHHARFSASSAGLVVSDLKSANGIYVRGTRISDPVTLSDGDRVRIGTHKFVVIKLSPAETGDSKIRDSQLRPKRKRVLLITHDHPFAADLVGLLTRSNIEACVALSLSDALAQTKPFDCAVVEAIRPGGTAEDTFRRLKDAGLAKRLVVLLRAGVVQPIVDGRVGPSGMQSVLDAIRCVIAEADRPKSDAPDSGVSTVRGGDLAGYSNAVGHVETIPSLRRPKTTT